MPLAIEGGITLPLVVTTAPPPRWPAGAQPLGPTDAPPYLLRVGPAGAVELARACKLGGYVFREAANVYEAGLILEAIGSRGT